MTRPVVGLVMRERIFRSVDFPAPLRPTMPTNSPCRTSISTPLSAHSVSRSFAAPFTRRARRGAGGSLWALRDVSFDIRPGEVVGFIGRNGAGKSTLLKILSRITEPTAGRVELRGRVGSLLEVGTGFHPELSGRENIYLNGSILGMRKREIDRKFDEIVAFSELEQFLDTPVKHYSSGMYTRLAFAVAAHLEPEMLIVDEVLAVGDAQFQAKCLAKMKDVRSHGRTVLFVSHNLTAVRGLCSRGIYLKSGGVVCDEPIDAAVDRYLSDSRAQAVSVPLRERADRAGNGRVRVVDFYVEDASGARQNVMKSGGDYVFVMEYEAEGARAGFHNVVGSIGVTDEGGGMVMLVRSSFTNQNLSLKGTAGRVECRVKDLALAQGAYGCVLFLSQGETEVLDLVEYAAELTVEGGDFFGTGSPGLASHCKVLTRAEWRAV